MTVKEIFETMDYGPAPESAAEALAWLVDQGDRFGHFIDGAFTTPGDGFDSKNPATGETLATLSQATQDDVDTEKGSRSRLTVGTTLTRGEMLHLALMSSENRAAHALGRTYPGGLEVFVAQMNAKARLLGMTDTRYVEPTGLSSRNQSSAPDILALVWTDGTEDLGLNPTADESGLTLSSLYLDSGSHTLTLTATDSDGEVTQVEILAGGESLAKRSEAPFEVDWTLANEGLQTVTVRATDNDGATSEATVSVAVYGDTPVPVDGLRLWLDGSSVTQEGGKVSAWADRTPFGHDVSQADEDLQPTLAADLLNGQAAVLFDGENDVLARAAVAGEALLSPDAVSVYAVVRQKWQSAVNTLLAWEAPNYKNHLALLMSYNNQFLVDHGNVSEGGRVSAAQPEGWDDAWHVLEFMREGNTATVNVDSDALELGEFGGALKVDVSGTLLVGEAATLAFGGEIAEVLIYNRALGVGERESVSQYLGVKYGFIEDVTPVDPNAPTLSAVQLAADDKFRFLVTGDKGGKVVLQFSENLDKWTDMQTYTNESGQLWININRGADAGRLFFRVRAE